MEKKKIAWKVFNNNVRIHFLHCRFFLKTLNNNDSSHYFSVKNDCGKKRSSNCFAWKTLSRLWLSTGNQPTSHLYLIVIWVVNFQGRDTKLDMYFLAKNQHNKRKLINLEIDIVSSCQILGMILGNKVF